MKPALVQKAMSLMVMDSLAQVCICQFLFGSETIVYPLFVMKLS